MDVTGQIESAFQQYWGGHFEVVKSFFGQPRPREQLVAWLELQLYKEIHVVPGKARELLKMYERLDQEVERGELEAVRRKYAGSGPLVRAVGGFAPGGGTAFAAAGSLIDGGPVQRLLAEA